MSTADQREMGSTSRYSNKHHHHNQQQQQQMQQNNAAAEDSFHNLDRIPCLPMKTWIDDLLSFVTSEEASATSINSTNTKKGQKVKKKSETSCLIALLWRCWLQQQQQKQQKELKQLVVQEQENNDDSIDNMKKKKRKNKKKQEHNATTGLHTSATTTTSSTDTSISSTVHDTIATAFSSSSLYPNRTLQQFFQSNHFETNDGYPTDDPNSSTTTHLYCSHIPFLELENYIQKHLETINCSECLRQAKAQFLFFSETTTKIYCANDNSNNQLSLMDAFRMTSDDEINHDVNDCNLTSMEEGLQQQQSQMYLSVVSNTTESNSHCNSTKNTSTADFLQLRGVAVPSNNNTAPDGDYHDTALKLWMDWIFSFLTPLSSCNNSSISFTRSNSSDGGSTDVLAISNNKQPQVELLLEQLLRCDSLDSNTNSGFLDQLFQCDASSGSLKVIISVQHQQMMVRIRDIRTRIFTNINWKQNESSLLSSSSTHHATNTNSINYRQKSHLDGIDQDLYTWLEEMTTLLLLITTDNPTTATKMMEKIWDTYENQLDVVLKASLNYRSEQMYSNNSSSVNLPLLWNNEQLRKFMEDKQSTQLEALQKIHVALEQILSSSTETTTSTTSFSEGSSVAITNNFNYYTKEDLLLQRILLTRASNIMRTIVKATKEEIRDEQLQKNNELLTFIKQFLQKITEKKNFVVSKVKNFLSTLVLPESQRDLVTEWKSKFLNQWKTLDQQTEDAKVVRF